METQQNTSEPTPEAAAAPDHSLAGMIYQARDKQYGGSYKEEDEQDSADDEDESEPEEASDDEEFGKDKKKKVARKPMARKAAAAVPKRQRSALPAGLNHGSHFSST